MDSLCEEGKRGVYLRNARNKINEESRFIDKNSSQNHIDTVLDRLNSKISTKRVIV